MLSPADPGLVPLSDIHSPVEMEDGGVMYSLGEPDAPEVEQKPEEDFYANIAAKCSPEKLGVLSGQLLEGIKQDEESRKEWEDAINLALKYTGFKITESRDIPFMKACSAFDASLSTALIKFYSTARSELFPAGGPAKCEVIGERTSEKEDQAERVKDFLNFFLTVKEKDYYPDSEKLVWAVGFYGSAFRKVYQDPALGQPVARFIPPYNLIINNNTTSLMTSDRITEKLELSRKDILMRQRSKDFIEFEIPKTSDLGEDDESLVKKGIERAEGINRKVGENKSLFAFYESHVSLMDAELFPKKVKLQDPTIPKPYVVTICKDTRKIVSVKRNWAQEDEKYARIECYVHYSYLPGFGIYSLGLAHIMGSNSITLTSIIRQLIDAGTLKNFPGGLRIRGMRVEDNDNAIGPGEFREMETGGMKIQDCLMLMPYAEPSSVLAALRTELKEEAASIASAVESQIPEIGSNAPVGTTLAMLEVANKVQTAILRSMHVSLGRELQLLYKIFSENLEDEPYPFAVPGKDISIMRQDFNDSVSVVPVSDPNILTGTYRLLIAEALLKIAQSKPEIHDMREVYYRMYSSMKVEDIEKILPKAPEPQALDPATDAMLILMGRPITVKAFQDNEAHITVKQQLLQNPFIQQNPAFFAQLMVNIQLHKAHQAYKEMYKEQKMQEIRGEIEQLIITLVSQGMPLEAAKMEAQAQVQQRMQELSAPPPMPEGYEDKLNLIPEVQNWVAKKDAEQAIQQSQKQAMDAQNALDPNKVMVMDVEQKREASHLKAESDKLRAETEAFKAQLKYESEMQKTENQRDIAIDKHDTEIAIASEKIENRGNLNEI